MVPAAFLPLLDQLGVMQCPDSFAVFLHAEVGVAGGMQFVNSFAVAVVIRGAEKFSAEAAPADADKVACGRFGFCFDGIKGLVKVGMQHMVLHAGRVGMQVAAALALVKPGLGILAIQLHNGPAGVGVAQKERYNFLHGICASRGVQLTQNNAQLVVIGHKANAGGCKVAGWGRRFAFFCGAAVRGMLTPAMPLPVICGTPRRATAVSAALFTPVGRAASFPVVIANNEHVLGRGLSCPVGNEIQIQHLRAVCRN